MKITDERPQDPGVRFENIVAGSVIESAGEFYMKIGLVIMFGKEYNAVNLRTGSLVGVGKDERFDVLDAELVIHGEARAE